MGREVSRTRESGTRKQFTVTISSNLGRYLEERAAESGLNKSAIVSEALETDMRYRKELLLREGYEEMAEQHLELAREFDQVDDDADWPDY